MAPQEAAPDQEQVNCLELFLLYIQDDEKEPLGWYFVRSVTCDDLMSPDNVVAAASSCQKMQLPHEVHVPPTRYDAHPCISLQPFAIWCEDMISTQATGSTVAENMPIPPPPPMPARPVAQDAVPGQQKRGGWGPRCEAVMNAYKRANYVKCDELIEKYERILRG